MSCLRFANIRHAGVTDSSLPAVSAGDVIAVAWPSAPGARHALGSRRPLYTLLPLFQLALDHLLAALQRQAQHQALPLLH